MRVIVVGAGLSGLTAARHIAAGGHDVTVLDKGRSSGGRCATRRIGDAVLDHGAQFFTVRSAEFANIADEWFRAGDCSRMVPGIRQYRWSSALLRIKRHDYHHQALGDWFGQCVVHAWCSVSNAMSLAGR